MQSFDSQDSSYIPRELLDQLTEVDHLVQSKATLSSRHPCDVAHELGIDMEHVTAALRQEDGELLERFLWNQLLTLGTMYQYSEYTEHASKRSFSKLLKLYAETGRFDLAHQLIKSLSGQEAKRYNTSLEGFRERHQLSNLDTFSLAGDRGSKSQSIPILLINLPQDIYRHARFQARCQELGLEFTVEPGLTPDEVWNVAHRFKCLPVAQANDKSTPACLDEHDRRQLRRSGNIIAQYNAWKKMVDEDITYAYIFEDDAWVDRSILDFDISENQGCGEIIFVNDRLVRHCRWQHQGNSELVTVAELSDPRLAFPCDNADIRAPGADGYLLSQAGARKLVKIIDNTGIPDGGTDWFLLTVSLDAHRLLESRDLSGKLSARGAELSTEMDCTAS
ncbi:glycosyltransferase family 25 protein [Synechococcus sp. CBW1107]|uniref:glycosyltransferase family 25 protein n=1 Tax=Synechococcus sp. CBW1107 TaxID=2789857 RepID=UPI0018CEB368|nr:glycosyltransferase family 25 protein [Synechococcus sp. CBW1107]QPN56633.1 glycosyltransferase family 25 protein [Synechococcus sp. CBW1107]